MTRYKERFHQAARDGYLDLLKEASKSEADSCDDNGMTPVMWAAFYGNLEALRMLISRGGSPDKTDLMGSTALHFSALNGHMPCVSFLVNFGANVWTLDNDLHTAMDLATLRDHHEIVEYLDSIASKQFSMNKKVVKKMKEKAGLDAQRRIKKFDRLMRKTAKKAEKAERKANGESGGGEGEKRSESVTTVRQRGKERGATTNPNYAHSGAVSGSSSSSHHRHHATSGSQSPRAFSEYFSTSRSSRAGLGVARRLIGGGHKRPTAADGRSQDVVYARSDGRSVTSGPISEPDFSTVDGLGDADVARPGSPGLFERPGFGSVAFFHQNPMTRTLQSLKDRQERQERQVERRDRPSASSSSPTRVASYTDSIGTSGSLLRRWRDLPWSEEEVENLDDDQDDDGTLAPHSELELFLACLGVTEFMPVFTAEQIDLEALGLCHDQDLQNLGLPLGPRKKILDALQRRREAMAADRSMQDLRL